MAVKFLVTLPDPPAVIEEEITDTLHDGWESAGGTWNHRGYFNANVAPVGNISGSTYGSFHFDSIPFNRNTNLESAIWKPYIMFVNSPGGIGRIRAQLVDDASLPDNSSNKPSGMTLTDNYVDMSQATLSTTGLKEFEIKDVINEVIRRPGWVNGNAINLIVEDNGSATGKYSSIALIDQANENGTPLFIIGD